MTELDKLSERFGDEDIEWRIQRANKKDGKPWAIIVPYVTNRAIQERLDETVGRENWCNDFESGPQGGVLCGISIRINDKWVTKWDGAENTDIEGVKGGLSNSMKRAAVQWGIGRFLYSFPKRIFANIHDKGKHWDKPKGFDEGFNWDPPALSEIGNGQNSRKEKQKPKENSTTRPDDYQIKEMIRLQLEAKDRGLEKVWGPLGDAIDNPTLSKEKAAEWIKRTKAVIRENSPATAETIQDDKIPVEEKGSQSTWIE